MSKQALSRPPRPPRTKEMLLPLATAKVRALSLENHLALATVRAGRGDFDQICCLIRVVYLAYFMRGETAAGDDVHPYRQAEAALDACIKRIEQDQPCLLLDHEQVVAERVLVLHDDQLAAVPKFRYLEAWEQLQRFIMSGKNSPILADAAVCMRSPDGGMHELRVNFQVQHL